MAIRCCRPQIAHDFGNEVDSVRRHEPVQWLRFSPRIDGRSIIQITSNKNRVRLFPQNFSNQAPQESPLSPNPRCTLLMSALFARGTRPASSQPHHRSRDPRPACVEKPLEGGHYSSTEQQFDDPMEVHVPCSHPNNSKSVWISEPCEVSAETFPRRPATASSVKSSTALRLGEYRKRERNDKTDDYTKSSSSAVRCSLGRSLVCGGADPSQSLNFAKGLCDCGQECPSSSSRARSPCVAGENGSY
jgi:hypothetical protein